MEFLKKRLIVYISLFLTLQSSSALAEDSSVAKGLWNDLKSPVTTDAVWVLGAGTLATTMVYLTKKNVEYRQRRSFKDAKPIGDLGFIGDYIGYGLLNVSYFGYFYWDYHQNKDLESLKKAEHMLRATSYTVGLTTALKYTIKERRPGYPDDHHSFPSGHSSASFAFASVIAAQHGWVWGGFAHGLATFIATSRINDDFHYLHDVAAGITIGASFAWGVYYNLENGSDYWLTLVPTPKKGAGLAFGMDF
jgi:membrane-associated phospholipid phosphatase